MRLVERLIAFRNFVPAYIESRVYLPGNLAGVHVNTVKSFLRSELHLQPILRILPVFQTPASYASRGRAPEITIGIFQMVVAQQNFGPLPAIFFKNGCPRDENRREICASRIPRGTIDGKPLLPSFESKIPPGKNIRMLAQRRF